MFLTKAKIATTMLLTVSLLTNSAGVLTHHALAGKPQPGDCVAPIAA
jgi:hypothetical protein